SVPIAGGSPVKLNGALVADGHVGEFQLSPNSQRVVYWADQDVLGVTEIYSVPILGGTPIQLNGLLVAGGDVGSYFAISPNSVRVIYRADQQTDGVDELYSVPIAGGSVAKLNGPLVTNGDVLGFRISPDSTRVVYLADQDVDEDREIWSVPIAGGTRTKLNGELPLEGDVVGYNISDDSAWVVYVADEWVNEWFFGYRAPLAGPAGSSELLFQRATDAGGPQFSIDLPRNRVVVLGFEAFVGGAVRLWSFPLAGTPDPTGGEELIPAADFDTGGEVANFEVGAFGTILYQADQTVDEELRLYAVPEMLFWDGFESGDTGAW
ncbi:MAG: hypothetical protein KDB94_11280, partial [Acidobacteria bacterium]|nr:hypothetical protein [Acidobacteriota bacterium]